MRIENKRIIIEPLEQEHLENTLNWINDKEIAYFMGINTPVTLRKQKLWYKNLKKDKTKRVFAIIYKNRHIGNISIDNISKRDNNARLTIFIGDKSLWGKGLGEDALKIFLKYCFNKLNLHRVYLIVHENNTRAINLYKKCGFKKEGLLREHECYNGKYINKVIMGILKSELKYK